MLIGDGTASSVSSDLTRRMATLGFLKGACHMSFSLIRKFFRDVIGVRVSRGQFAKLIGKFCLAHFICWDAFMESPGTREAEPGLREM